MLLPFDKQRGVLEILIDKMINLQSRALIVLATTSNPADYALVALAQQKKILVFRVD